jgi:hypothetical protein
MDASPVNKPRYRDPWFFSQTRQRNRWRTLFAIVVLALGIAGLITFFPPEEAKGIKVSRFIGTVGEDSGFYQVKDQEYIPHSPESGNAPVYVFLQPDYPLTKLKQEVRKKPKPLERPKKKSQIIPVEKQGMAPHKNGNASGDF